jgi:hypothetical protein
MPKRYHVIFDDGAHADLAGIKAYLTEARSEEFAARYLTEVRPWSLAT